MAVEIVREMGEPVEKMIGGLTAAKEEKFAAYIAAIVLPSPERGDRENEKICAAAAARVYELRGKFDDPRLRRGTPKRSKLFRAIEWLEMVFGYGACWFANRKNTEQISARAHRQSVKEAASEVAAWVRAAEAAAWDYPPDEVAASAERLKRWGWALEA